ncbi:hypothetical protein [Herbidospora sp. RD11066]
MNLVHLYPWDVTDGLADLGVDGVMLAASYHSVRAATPRHPAHRHVTAPHAASYVPVRREKYARLVPAEPTWTSRNAFAETRARLRGLPVHAWTVLTHSSALGTAHPDLAVVNAFGDLYEYALCPSAEEVRAYCRALVGEVLELGEPDGLLLEACGPLGVTHAGHHDKTFWTPVQAALLSICFCAACLLVLPEPEELRRRVRAGVDAGLPPEEALGDLADRVREIRVSLSTRLRDEVVEVVGGRVPIALHANPDPWAAMPSSAVVEAPKGVDVLVANCWGPDGERRVEALSRFGLPVAAYVQALGADPQELVQRYRQARDLHWYHAGMASADLLRAIGEAISGDPARRTRSPQGRS